ncbi:MAG: hypothetical protein ISQ52_10790 [Synechococcus sp. BS307-5m-G38]|nr:hypothetical protein [Synechococcus sp. BS307-5m-G38]
MTDRSMSWDPSLLRKFTSTGHFRLLNQLRGDLNKRPLDRNPATGELKMPGSGGRYRRPASSVSRRPGPTSNAVSAPTPSSPPATIQTSSASMPATAPQQETARTFRERLNAIDMR